MARPPVRADAVPPREQEPAAENAAQHYRWFLGFDCATKTFAFSLSFIDVGRFRRDRARLFRQARATQEILDRAKTLSLTDPSGALEILRAVEPSVAAVDAETKSLVRLVDGTTVDLFPGRPDAEVSTVERIQAVVRFVAGRIRPALGRHVPAGERFRTVVEFQMGPNAPARAVAAALIALFAEDNVIIVGPTLKNKIATCEAGRYCYFAERFNSSYAANKAHAKFNFARVEDVFGTSIPALRPPSLRGHIADSFMQVLGHLVHGHEENAASHF